MRPLTKIESHLLNRFKHDLSNSNIVSFKDARVLLFFSENDPSLRLTLQLPNQRPLEMKVLAYGLRPVRYQIEIPRSEETLNLCQLWERCLGPSNKLMDRTRYNGERCQIFFEVHYSQQELKKLEE